MWKKQASSFFSWLGCVVVIIIHKAKICLARPDSQCQFSHYLCSSTFSSETMTDSDSIQSLLGFLGISASTRYFLWRRGLIARNNDFKDIAQLPENVTWLDVETFRVVSAICGTMALLKRNMGCNDGCLIQCSRYILAFLLFVHFISRHFDSINQCSGYHQCNCGGSFCRDLWWPGPSDAG